MELLDMLPLPAPVLQRGRDTKRLSISSARNWG
jgi:hypothetical protein